MVHSSFDRFEGFRGKATDVILSLQATVGPTGTILMPTIPFTGTAVEYVAEMGIFDVVTTPSRMGLITELFRRAPGVSRSLHPTHSVAAWGAQADELLRDHHLAETPCGKNTPFGRLSKYDGKILLLGTDIDSMTFFHSIEEDLEPLMPFSPFTKETFRLHSKDRNGRIWETRTRLFDPDVSRRRNLHKLVPALRMRGLWRENHVGRLRGICLKAGDVLALCRAMAQSGEFCYDA
jgi:aminoglycoside 3-N-acetyltransferase